MTLPRYQDPDWKDQRPPTLIGEGARVNPEWLMRFLNNPSLTDEPKDMDRDGVRRYLHARMPTFYFSDGEIQKLVRFFAAMSSQARLTSPTSSSRFPIRSAPWRGSCSRAKARPA